MDRDPSTPSDDPPGWGQRRRGSSPPPRADWNQVRHEFDQAAQAWEAHRAADGDGPDAGPPPPGASAHRPASGPDLSTLFVLLDTLRHAAQAELQERTTALIREVLLTLRSLIDWYLERLDGPAEKPRVEDIRID